MRTPMATLVGLVVLSAASRSADEPKVIPAAEARKHLDEQATVELTVQSAKHAVPRRVTYLDSETDFKDPRNLAVLIPDDALPRFAEAGINDPAAHYKGKTVRVTGKIVLLRELDAVRIEVAGPAQIVEVKP